jgi:hypothetical protein
MKRIYEFTVDREETVKDETVETQKDGSEVTISKDVKKQVARKFFLRRPTRSMTDDAELYYGVKLADGIKAGLLTRALLEKRFENDGGTRSDEENEQYQEILQKLQAFHKEQTKILEVPEKKRTVAQKKKLKELENEIKPVRKDLRDLQLVEDSLYEETAENRARNKVILWWMLHLSYWDVDGKDVPFFGEGSFEQKLERYDEIDEGEVEFDVLAARKLAYYVSFWFVGKPNSQEEFTSMIDLALQLDKEEVEPEVEEPPKKPVKKAK